MFDDHFQVHNFKIPSFVRRVRSSLNYPLYCSLIDLYIFSNSRMLFLVLLLVFMFRVP